MLEGKPHKACRSGHKHTHAAANTLHLCEETVQGFRQQKGGQDVEETLCLIMTLALVLQTFMDRLIQEPISSYLMRSKPQV